MIEETLNRIATALETIAAAMQPQTTRQIVAVGAELRETTIGQDAAAVVTSAETVAPRSRQEIKQKLDDLGIAYNDRLRTENLEKILQDHENAQKQPAAPAAKSAPAAPAEDPFTPPAAPQQPQQTYKVTPADPNKPGSRRTVVPNPPPADVQADFFGGDTAVKPAASAAKTYTTAEAIEIAKRLAAKFGPDKSVTIIQSFGCAKISEIEAKGKLQEFVTKVLAKEKEYEKR